MLSLSLKNELDNTAFPPVFIPNPPTLDNYRRRLRARTTSCSISGTRSWSPAARCSSGSSSACRPATASRAARSAKFAILILIARMTPALSYLIPLFLLFQIDRARRHDHGAPHHPSRHHHPDHRLDHDRLFRERADGARGRGARRRRHALAGLPPCRAAAGEARHRRRRHPRLHLLLEQLHLLGRARRQDDAAPCPRRSTTC